MKTAVEWLFEQYVNKGIITIEYIEQAKQMEKDQMKLSRVPIAYENKSWQGLMERHFEQWYNETFKSE
jgi:coenzyme F420-reducing hydrogenase beta subunit